MSRATAYCLYTDGVTDAACPDGSFFGEERLRDLLAREHAAGDSPQEVVRRLTRTAIEHSATPASATTPPWSISVGKGQARNPNRPHGHAIDVQGGAVRSLACVGGRS